MQILIFLSLYTVSVYLIRPIFTAKLFPRQSQFREVISLDGIWEFTYGESFLNSTENCARMSNCQPMPVPSSYNDITTDARLRDHVGPVWYRKNFWTPMSWKEMQGRIFLRFSSVCYQAKVWFNKELVTTNNVGHLPFEVELTSKIKNGNAMNEVIVSVDNQLSNDTVPQGAEINLPNGGIKLSHNFDFFYYAGIDRSVFIYTTPSIYIDDIEVSTGVNGTEGLVNYNIVIAGGKIDDNQVLVNLWNEEANLVASDFQICGTLSVKNVQLWWPYLMHPKPAYMYRLQVHIVDGDKNIRDTYELSIGIRTITWNTTELLINGCPLYFRGFGKHEDSHIHGKGLDLSLAVRDFNLIKWIGANSFRTSHYPYADEVMDLADRMGIMVINEFTTISLGLLTNTTMETLKTIIERLMVRDRHRPSTVMWSVAQTRPSARINKQSYSEDIVKFIKNLDDTRPVTINGEFQYVDVLTYTLYEGWYNNLGQLDVITQEVIKSVEERYKYYQKPILLAEYGAEALLGTHQLPPLAGSLEYQQQLLSQFFRAFDNLLGRGYFVGEMVWNFADFDTPPSLDRLGGVNRKGIFTRDRQPKPSAQILRKRYWYLAEYLDQVEIPDDVDEYIFQNCSVDQSSGND